MLSNPLAAVGPSPVAVAGAGTKKVVIVNGNTSMLEMLEDLLEAGHYDVVFVESSDHAYSQIKNVQPHLVILCMQIDDNSGFQVLSMLKLDSATEHIPVLTYTSDGDEDEAEEEEAEPSDTEVFPRKPVVRMN